MIIAHLTELTGFSFRLKALTALIMCHGPSTRLEKDLTSPLIPRGTWNTILVHIHDSFLLPQTTKTFTFTWGAHLLSLNLWGFFKSELRCAEIWDLCLLYRCSQSTQVHCSIPPLSVLQEQLLQLLLSPGLECSAHKQKQFTTLESKLLLDPAVLNYVICKIIWVVAQHMCTWEGRFMKTAQQK